MKVTTLHAPGASNTVANAINDRGEILGSYFDSSGQQGLVYDDGTVTAPNAPGAIDTEVRCE